MGSSDVDVSGIRYLFVHLRQDRSCILSSLDFLVGVHVGSICSRDVGISSVGDVGGLGRIALKHVWNVV